MRGRQGVGMSWRHAIALGLPLSLLVGSQVGGSIPAPGAPLTHVLESQGEFRRLLAVWQQDSLAAWDTVTLQARVRAANRAHECDAALLPLETHPGIWDPSTSALVRASLEERAGRPQSCLDALAAAAPPAGLANWAALLAAQASVELGRWEDARSAAARVDIRTLAPEFRQRLVLLRARIAHELHDVAALRRMAPELGEAARADDRTGLLLVGLAREAARAGEELQARAWWLDLLEARPTPAESAYADLQRRPAALRTPATVLRMARFEMRSGRHSEARARLRGALERGLPPAERGQARLAIAESFLRSGDPGNGLAACTRAARDTRGTALEAERLRLRARALRRLGRIPEALQAYRDLATRFPRHEKADDALYEVGWLQETQRQFAAAERAYLRVARAYPNASLADDARLRAGLCALRAGRPEEAAEHMAHLVAQHGRSSLVDNALYWQMLAQIDLGDAAGALALRDRLERDFPRSYFTALARRRVEQGLAVGHLPEPESATVTALDLGPDVGLERAQRVTAAYDSAIVTLRAFAGKPSPAFEADTALWRFFLDWGFDREAAWETRRLERRYDNDSGALLDLLAACHARGAHERLVRIAYVLGQRISDPAARDAEEILLYPAPYAPSLAAACGKHHLSPATLLGLMRQESAFDPRIDSAVGARGLMQLMPEVGRRMASQEGWTGFHPDLLYDAAANAALGCALFAAEIHRAGGDVPQALAAYNAGADVAAAWRARLGPGEARELYVDVAEYAETRTYLKTVLGNAETYRRLYALP